MNTQRDIALNGLTLLVKQNDPRLFDNPEIFEKNLVDNGCFAGSEEVKTLKESLKLRIPWEVRRGGTLIEPSFAELVIKKFGEKAKLSDDLSRWAVFAWIAALGLKVKAESQQAPLPQNKDKVVEEKPSQADDKAFFEPKGRLGIVFGQDSDGSLKVFNTWYKEASSYEKLNLAATPVKLKQEPVVLFKAAPKKKKEKISKKETNASSVVNSPQNVGLYKEVEYLQPMGLEQKLLNQADGYILSDVEKTAMSLLQKGGAFADTALRMLAPIAKAGSAFACRIMGETYYRGCCGIKQNYNAAKAWLKLAVDKGDAESMYLMGKIYQLGEGAERNLPVAKSYFEKAAQKGHKKALESLSIL